MNVIHTLINGKGLFNYANRYGNKKNEKQVKLFH